jgi:hypothetical protein
LLLPTAAVRRGDTTIARGPPLRNRTIAYTGHSGNGLAGFNRIFEGIGLDRPIADYCNTIWTLAFLSGVIASVTT